MAITLTRAKKIIAFLLLGITAAIGSSCNSSHQIEASITALQIEPLSPSEPILPAKTVAEDLPLTPSELQEFDSIMLELDPDQQLVNKITQQKLSTIVQVTTGPGFLALAQDRQQEIAVGMQTGLGQVCLCSPHLKFSTEDGQQIIELDQQRWH
ncbi:MAG: hypothetical protein ACFB2W_27115 [Leptolyngbyaceae cyanobacterium]